jgi:26S proteasome regulatory subunit N6
MKSDDAGKAVQESKTMDIDESKTASTTAAAAAAAATSSSLSDEEFEAQRAKFIDSIQSEYDSAHEIDTLRPLEAIQRYKKIIFTADPNNDITKFKEDAILRVGQLYGELNKINEFKEFFVSIRPFFNTIAKARTAKIVRQLIEQMDIEYQQQQQLAAGVSSSKISAAKKLSDEEKARNLLLQNELCRDAIEWCVTEKRTFLKQRIQSRLASILLKQGRYQEAITLLTRLTKEVKRFDDKQLLVELHLLESRIHLALNNLPKSKGALTAARSNANAIYCPPSLQAEIDLAAGILSSAEHDYKTSFSYFYEAYEGYNTIKDSIHAVQALKYMLLTKIMLNQYDDVYSIINGKAGVKYSGKSISMFLTLIIVHSVSN